MLTAAKHLQTETDAQKIEQSRAEVAFVGRSNAGKSTLINALCQKRKMAFVSQVPGKTRTVNVYEVRPFRWLVDLPGYGFAVGRKTSEVELGEVIEGYLTSRENLRQVFILIDAVAGPTKLDLLMIGWMAHKRLPFRVIVNKIDKLGPVKMAGRKIEIASQLALDPSQIFWISSAKGLALEPLRQEIIQWLKD